MRLEVAVLLLWTLGALACGGGPEGGSQERADSGPHSMHDHHDSGVSGEPVAGPELYEARGTVLFFEPGRVYLNHEEMPGFMDAMAMGFDVRDPTVLEGIEQGASVEFRVVVEPDTFYIDEIHPVE